MIEQRQGKDADSPPPATKPAVEDAETSEKKDAAGESPNTKAPDGESKDGAPDDAGADPKPTNEVPSR